MANLNHGNFATALPLPRGFGGTRPEQWKDFAYKLKAYMNMQEHDFTNYMNLAAASVEPVTDERHILEQDGRQTADERGVRMSRQLKYLLITLCSGPPLTIIQSADTETGFEVRRYFPGVTQLIQWSVNTEHLLKYLNHYFLKLTFKMPSFTGKQASPDGNEKLAQYSQTT